MSNPLSDENMDEVQRIISEVLSQFTTEFADHYKDAIVTDMNGNGTTGAEKDITTKVFQLPESPIPDYLLKSGVMCKKGILLVICVIHNPAMNGIVKGNALSSLILYNLNCLLFSLFGSR